MSSEKKRSLGHLDIAWQKKKEIKEIANSLGSVLRAIGSIEESLKNILCPLMTFWCIKTSSAGQ